MELVVLAVIVIAVLYKLGLFGPILDLSDVATRESSVYNREHKVKVAVMLREAMLINDILYNSEA